MMSDISVIYGRHHMDGNEAGSPPPPYEAVVHQSDSLCYMNFWPKSLDQHDSVRNTRFESFAMLLEKANAWLAGTPNTCIKSCEVIEKKVDNFEDIYSGKMNYSGSSSRAIFIQGLRVWFSLENRGGTQTNQPTAIKRLGYINVVPKRLSHDDSYAEFESFNSLMSTLNSRLEQNPLEGRIIAVNTVIIKTTKESVIWDEIDVDVTSWKSKYKSHAFFFLRVFYEIGTAINELIGFVDFIPDVMIEERSLRSPIPIYTPFQQASEWIRQNGQEIRVTNMQTLPYLRGRDNSRVSTRASLVYTATGAEMADTHFLRVAYVRPIHDILTNAVVPYVTFKTFVPSYIRFDYTTGAVFETMDEVMYRARVWINATGAKILFAETAGPVEEKVAYEKTTDSRSSPHRSPTCGSGNERKSIYYILLYLDGYYPEPPPHVLPPLPSNVPEPNEMVEEEDDCCIIM